MIGWLIVIGLLLLILAVLLTPLAFQFDYDDVRQHRFYRLSWLGITVLSSEKAGKIRDSSRKKKPKAEKKTGREGKGWQRRIQAGEIPALFPYGIRSAVLFA